MTSVYKCKMPANIWFKMKVLFLSPVVNFTNILWPAFTRADPKCAKRYWQLGWIFMLLGSAVVKAARKMVVKFSPALNLLEQIILGVSHTTPDFLSLSCSPVPGISQITFKSYITNIFIASDTCWNGLSFFVSWKTGCCFLLTVFVMYYRVQRKHRKNVEKITKHSCLLLKVSWVYHYFGMDCIIQLKKVIFSYCWC
jgi:hypothetical protein